MDKINVVPMWDVATGRPTTGVARTGVWLIAATSAAERYPCRCRTPDPGTWARQWCGFYGWFAPGCPCWGRPDRENLPAWCCARV